MNELEKALVSEDICPQCLGELDTGYECNVCGYDARHIHATPQHNAAEYDPQTGAWRWKPVSEGSGK